VKVLIDISEETLLSMARQDRSTHKAVTMDDIHVRPNPRSGSVSSWMLHIITSYNRQPIMARIWSNRSLARADRIRPLRPTLPAPVAHMRNTWRCNNITILQFQPICRSFLPSKVTMALLHIQIVLQSPMHLTSAKGRLPGTKCSLKS
jgi:hypothetical protein